MHLTVVGVKAAVKAIESKTSHKRHHRPTLSGFSCIICIFELDILYGVHYKQRSFLIVWIYVNRAGSPVSK
jgi:hypothetical protein